MLKMFSPSGQQKEKFAELKLEQKMVESLTRTRLIVESSVTRFGTRRAERPTLSEVIMGSGSPSGAA